MDAQLRLEWLADGSGLDEASQSSIEDGILRPNGQPDSQPTGGEVIDGAPPAVSCSDTFLDQALVSGRVWKRSILLLLGRLPTRRNPPGMALRPMDQAASS
ncbi:MAG TPA: hypothetical protein VN969_10795 [Streptosporangiaceae bacterium]|nr:hypothetical protein [Streptosporangiaceae bacterium]